MPDRDDPITCGSATDSCSCRGNRQIVSESRVTVDQDAIVSAILGLDRWFDSLRVEWPTPGYGGPVVHWWNHCLGYQGTGLDWRYEGIIAGYLALWERTDQRVWLDKAVRAGKDLVNGQLPDGSFRNSRFELNPGIGGTPHEAAADVGLLMLADSITDHDAVVGDQLFRTARHNLESYWIEQLWHESTATLWDDPGLPSFVPNKAATFVDAILILAKKSANDDLVERFVLPTVKNILDMQVADPTSPLDGAIAQNRFGNTIIEAYFPLYIARCIPPLLAASGLTGDPQERSGALRAVRFLERVRDPDGGFPQVIYRKGKMNRYPRWIAGAGDIVRAFVTANEYGAEVDPIPTINWILSGVRLDGHIATASGFRRVVPWVSRRDRHADEIGVVGWCDKAFRALSIVASHHSYASNSDVVRGSAKAITAST